MAHARLVLGSASPRRSQLLAERGIRFRVLPSAVDETLPHPMGAQDAALYLAKLKALAVVQRMQGVPDFGEMESSWVLGADTVVALGDDRVGEVRLLGKPEDPTEARSMLSSLSGTRHRVVTGVACVRVADGALRSEAETTWVSMRSITPAEIDAYVASEEWRDKAGGYAIQENADAFVAQLEGGGFDNVVGLPVDLSLGPIGRIGLGKRLNRPQPPGIQGPRGCDPPVRGLCWPPPNAGTGPSPEGG